MKGEGTRLVRGHLWIAVFCVGAMQTACSRNPEAPSEAAPTTFVQYTSEAGDFVGGGKSARLTLATASFTPFVNDHFNAGIRQSIALTIRPFAASDVVWNLDLLSTVGRRLTVGTYENAEWIPSSPEVPGLDFVAGRGCNRSTGRFEILEVVYGSNQPLDRLHVTFEQRCVGSVAALRGELRIVADPWR